MPYTGNVSPGSPPAVRELPDLTITKVSVGSFDNNAYLLRCTHTGEQLLIDAANEPERLLELVGDTGLAQVVTTHRHPDHWQALRDVVAATGARALAHPADAPELPVPVEPVADGDSIPVGNCTLAVIHLVGHTPGSIALLYRDPYGIPHLLNDSTLGAERPSLPEWHARGW